MLVKVMETMRDRFGVVFVTAAGNDGVEVDSWPSKAGAHLPDMLVVGATSKNGVRAQFSNYGPLVNVWAPGDGLAPIPQGLDLANSKEGTSFGKCCRCPSCTLVRC